MNHVAVFKHNDIHGASAHPLGHVPPMPSNAQSVPLEHSAEPEHAEHGPANTLVGKSTAATRVNQIACRIVVGHDVDVAK